MSKSWICSVERRYGLPARKEPTPWLEAGSPSSLKQVGSSTTTTTTDDLLKFCQKVLDILTNREHYVSTLGREIPLFGPIYVRHLVTAFEAWAIKYSVVRVQAGNFCMVPADCFAERQE